MSVPSPPPPTAAPGPSLRLRPLRADDEPAFVAAHRSMAADSFPFGLGYEPGMAWDAYLAELERQRTGIGLADGLVPATFLVACVDATIAGRASVRHTLNDYLARQGGHIGYGVLATHRRQGHAIEILRQSLVVARSLGVDRVLVTCDDDNLGSATVIERCGGVFESIVGDIVTDEPIRRYWFD